MQAQVYNPKNTFLISNFLLKISTNRKAYFYLFLLFAFKANVGFSQLYKQTFDTQIATQSNTLLTTAPYCATTPNNTQLSSIGSNGTGCTFGVPVSKRLTFTRTADVGTFTRGIDFSPIPVSLLFKFDLQVSGNTSAETNGAKIQIGYNYNPTTFTDDTDDVNVHSRIGINWTSTPGEFSLRNGTNTISSANFTGMQTVFWAANKTGSTISYMGPDGLVNTLANEKDDVWIGNTLVFDDINVVTSVRYMRRFKFFFNSGNATLEFDNFQVAPIPSAPIASSTQYFCGVVNPTIANLTASGSNLLWYSAATGGSSLAANTSLVNGTTYYVSQNPDGFESHRTAVTVSLLNVGISNNVISSSQIICTGTTPDPFTGTVPVITNGSGPFTYAWEVSTTGPITGFAAIAGGSTQDYSVPTTLSANRWYRRKITADGCIDYSNVLSIGVNPVITNTITNNQTICVGIAAATLTGTPGGGNGSFTFVWESSTTDGTTGFSPISGAENQTYAPGSLSQTTWFRRIVSAGPCPSSTSAAIQITVIPAIASNTIGSDQLICSGIIPDTFTVSTPSGGIGTYIYQWEISSTSALAGFASISGANSMEYSIPTALAGNRWYRRKINSGACLNDYSNVLSIAINPVIGNNTISTSQTICSTNPAATLNGSVPVGGGGAGTYGFQWESSTTSATIDFTPISGANGQTYSPGLLTETTWFRRVVTSPPCSASISATVLIVVNNPILNNSITKDDTICTGTAPSVFVGSVPTGGNGTSFTYLWQVSTSVAGNFVSPGGVTNEIDYTSPTLSGNRWFRRTITSGVCPVSYSDTIKITVHTLIGNNTINSPQTICSTNLPATLNGSVPVGAAGAGSYSFQWESSTTSATLDFTPILGANDQTYSPGLLTETTWFRRIVISPPCANSTSPAILITVTTPILNNSATGPQTFCSGIVPNPLEGSTPTGGNGTFAYLWQYQTTIGGIYTSASGTNNQIDYVVPALPANRWYRRRVTSGVCPVTYSDTILLTVNPIIGNNTITASQNICSTNPAATLTGSTPVGGGGVGSYSFQWESSTTSATLGFSPISGTNSQNYSPGLLSETTWFRRVVISPPCANSTSTAIQITVTNPILNNTATGPQTTCSGIVPNPLEGSIPTGGNGTSFAYLWENQTTIGGSFTTASGSNNQVNFSVPALSATRWYRRRIISGFCPATYSDTIQMTVHPIIGNNTISGNQTICGGTSPTTFNGSSPVGGNLTYNFQWESSTTSSSTGFSPISGAEDQTYSSGPLNQTTWFRRVVTSPPCANHTSGVITVTVQQPIGNNSISENQSICSGSDPSTFSGTVPTGGTGTYSYLWEFSNFNSGPFSSAGGNTINFSSGSLSADRWFRRRIISGVCPANYSDIISVMVTPSITTNTISGNQLLCDGAPTNPIIGSNPGGGTGIYDLSWEVSTTSASSGFSIIPGEIGTDYHPGPLSQTSWFRRWVSSGACNISTNVAAITVSPAPTITIGPTIPEIPQGGTTVGLGGSFGGSATGAVWSTPLGGVFMNNSGSVPNLATYTASGSSTEWIPVTLTSVGGSCGSVNATKLIHVIPDTNGISGSPNVYVKVVGPALITAGVLSVTVEAGGGAKFQPGDKAMMIQMKGASASNSTASDASYGSILALGSAGNYEMVVIQSVAGEVITFERCVKKIYSTGFKVQLVKVARYTGRKNIIESPKVSTVQLLRKGMGYAPNSIISGITVDNTGSFGSGLVVSAKSDALGQVVDINIIDPGNGYVFPPKITFPDPTVSPYNLPAYKARAQALLNFSGKQWNGETGGILVIECKGRLNLGSNIEMTGMGLAGGMFGDKAGSVDCSATPAYGLDFFTGHSIAGQKGEGLNPMVTSPNQRGRGKNTTGGGGGFDSEAGGGGGANWNDGGRGGSSSYTFYPCTQNSCDKNVVMGGIGGAADGVPNGVRARAYNYAIDKNRVFLGGGGGGGHALNSTLGEQSDGAGGYGGGLIFIFCDTLTSNGFEVRAEGMAGESVTTGDGAGGGGGGGAIMMNIKKYTDAFNGRVNGGAGGNTEPTVCANINDLKTYRFYGAGGGGGGGVVWFTQNAFEVLTLATSSNLSQSQRGSNQDNPGNSALKGGNSRQNDSFLPVENVPYLGSVFTVGGTSPTPTFANLQLAAEWLSFKGTDASEVTLLVKENTSLPTKMYDYQQPVIFKPIFTPGCTVGDATLVIKPLTTVNSVDLKYPDSNRFMLLDGIPGVTFKDLTISCDSPEIPFTIEVQGNSTLKLENVTANLGITIKTGTNNVLESYNTIHGGSITLEANQIANIHSSITMNGSNSLNKQLIMQSGSTLNMPSGTLLDMNGASITNNGGIFNINPAAEVRLSGNLNAQIIGGSANTSFDKLNITSTGTITINTPTTVREWNQTGSATINHNNRTLTVTEKLIPGLGGFVGLAAGKVILSHPTQVVEGSGFFANLEIDAPAGVLATAPITLSQNLILTNGKLNMGSNLLTVNGTSSSAITHTGTSWIVGTLKQKVVSGNTYALPIGTSTHMQKAQITINSLVGLQNLTVSFNETDPMANPVLSTLTPETEGMATYSSLFQGGFWSINPNAGTANYDLSLYPSFASGYPFYTIYKRPTAGNVWDLFGSLSNPEATATNLQSDGSIRRSGFSGFSDFAIAVAEEPLPLNFIDFKATKRANGIRLNWKMADCLSNGRFAIKRATQNSDFTTTKAVQIREDGNCQSEFESIDSDPLNVSRVYYQIEASSRDEKTILSPVRVVQVIDINPEKPFLSPVRGDSKQYELVGESLADDGINIYSMDGKTLGTNLKAVDRILDLHTIPSGVYLVEMVNSGWKVRQKIVVGN